MDQSTVSEGRLTQTQALVLTLTMAWGGQVHGTTGVESMVQLAIVCFLLFSKDVLIWWFSVSD